MMDCQLCLDHPCRKLSGQFVVTAHVGLTALQEALAQCAFAGILLDAVV
jgi:hypothetical protein